MRVALVLVALLWLPTVLAHGGHEHPEAAGSTDPSARPTLRWISPGVTEQANPHTDGDTVVWQAKSPNGDWDIYALNISRNVTTLVAGGPGDEIQPRVTASFVAYVANVGDPPQARIIDLANRRLDTLGPIKPATRIALDDPLVAWVLPNGSVLVYDYQRELQLPLIPAQAADVAVTGSYVAWLKVTGAQWLVSVHDAYTGSILIQRSGRGLMPAPHRLAFTGTTLGWLLPSHSRPLHLLNLETGQLYQGEARATSGSELDGCDAGLVWKQFHHQTEKIGLSLFLPGLNKTGVYSAADRDFRQPACGGDYVVAVGPAYGKASIAIVDALFIRPPALPSAELDRHLWGSILTGHVNLTGWATAGDPVFPIETVMVYIDEFPGFPVEGVEPHANGSARWWVSFDTAPLANGPHRVQILVVDARPSGNAGQFGFFTDNVDAISSAELIARNQYVPPVALKKGFVEGIADHYLQYQRFYNTILFVLIGIFLLVRMVVRWRRSRPPPAPEYVPPPSAQPTFRAAGPQGPPPR